MTTVEIIAQIIGFIGTACSIAAFQIRKPKTMYAMQFVAMALFVIHYALLGSWGGFFMNSIAVGRAVLLLGGKRTKTLPCFIIVELAFAAFTVVTISLGIDSLWAILPGIGCLLQTIGLWSRSPKKTRWYQMLGSSPFWIAYNSISNSWSGVICECFAICSCLLYLIRHRGDNESDLLNDGEAKQN